MTETLRGALIGYGFIGSNGHLPAYLERERTQHDVRIEAVADVCPERRAAAAARIPGVRLYNDAESLLAAESQRVDFVDIATPPSDHARIARAALSRGLHVLCEKPLATTSADADAMLVAARRARRVIFPCHNYLHAPVIREVRRAIDSGDIGDINLVTLNTYRTTHARGVEEWRTNWRREREIAGGGIGMDHGSHTFYLAFDWLGAYPTAITAKALTLGPYDTEDNLSCTITFPTGMAVAHLTWTAGVRKVIYTIHGTRGAITVEDDIVQIQRKARADGVTPAPQRISVPSRWQDAGHSVWFGTLFDEFVHAMRTGDHVGKYALDALHCVRLIEAAYASSRQSSRDVEVEISAAPEAAA